MHSIKFLSKKQIRKGVRAEFRLKGNLTSINAPAQRLRLIMLCCVYESLSVHQLVGPSVRQDGSLPTLKVDKENWVAFGVRMAVWGV